MPPMRSSPALDALRARLQGRSGQAYWRALDEIADTPALREELAQALPQLSSLAPAMGRRGFLRLLGASLALAGLGACRGPAPQQIVPARGQPEHMPHALPQFWATVLEAGGDVAGVLVETHQGRPTHLEGNPRHPGSLGATSPLLQAAILELWDPERSQVPLHRGQVSTWDAFDAVAADIAARFNGNGAGLHVLSGAITSPTLAVQRQQLLNRSPGLQWHQYEAVDQDGPLAGSEQAFGTALQPRYALAQARVIVTLEADLLGSLPGHLRHAREWASARQPDARDASVCRLYAIDATPSLTSARADHAWPLPSGQIAALARELALALGLDWIPAGTPSGLSARHVQALARDLGEHRGHGLVVAGPSQPAQVHALVHRINAALGNVGQTVSYFEWPEPRQSAGEGLQSLLRALDAGQVDTLVVLDGNPLHAAPAAAALGQRLAKAGRSIHLGLYADETAHACTWHLPRAHALEAWSDLRAHDGTAAIAQPVIAPLYQGQSAHQLLARLMGQAGADGRTLVRQTWPELDDAGWTRALREGLIANSRPPQVRPRARVSAELPQPAPAREDQLELVFRPDPRIWDGRYANNAWLQELPKPLTRLTWSNVVLISPALAAAGGLANGDIVLLRAGPAHVQAPVWIMPGQATNTLTVFLGYGRTAAGAVGNDLGYEANQLRSLASPWRIACDPPLTTGRRAALASTQQHHRMEGRAPVRSVSLSQLVAGAAAFEQDQGADEPPHSLYPPRNDGDYAWGMSINLDACIGCDGCTLACQSENNIPVVGAEEVRRGRELHWIRVDRYFEGPVQAPRVVHQPVPCMHCEQAPCEVVCPVGATVHDGQGLNLQVYNRCVGTRFCSNNCPYKVRRFNFLQYADLHTESLKAMRNPQVSVRNRGVMEKCTYCIQRIENAHIAANREGRRIADGQVRTACQNACPTQAISFGDVADPGSKVSQAKASPRHYALLEELGTRPRTSYLAMVRNPNAELKGQS